jgi:hypothetical protein
MEVRSDLENRRFVDSWLLDSGEGTAQIL